MLLLVILQYLCYVKTSNIAPDLVPKITVHFYIDFTSRFLKQIWLFPYPYGLCDPVRIHGMKISAIQQGNLNFFAQYYVWSPVYPFTYLSWLCRKRHDFRKICFQGKMFWVSLYLSENSPSRSSEIPSNTQTHTHTRVLVKLLRFCPILTTFPFLYRF
jgi:hypothetical protein